MVTPGRAARGCKAIYEDQAGEQFILDDDGRRVYGVYQIPEAECLGSGAVGDVVIGTRLFVDGAERDVFRDGDPMASGCTASGC